MIRRPAVDTIGKPDTDLRALLQKQVLVCDGAMGTMLLAAGVPLDLSPQELNITRPDLVKAIHSAYIAAGADIIQTNTFGASRFRLASRGLGERVGEINRAGAGLARAAADASDHAVLVAGSVSPITPPSARGKLAPAAIHAAFREQMTGLYEGGVDLLIFETFGNVDELVEAIVVAGELRPSLPLVAQLTFFEDGRTLSGQTPAEVVQRLEPFDLAAIGVNCTLGPQALLEVVQELGRHTALPLAAQPNAGSPNYVDGRIQYGADPEYFSRYARRFAEAGASLVGGCCGTTPGHVEAVAAAVADVKPPLRTPARRLRASRSPARVDQPPKLAPSRLLTRLKAHQFLTIAELSPPTGGTADRAVNDAAMLKKAGCDAVLIGASSGPRPQVSPASLAVLVQQRVRGLEALLTVFTWEKSLMTLQADLLGAYAFGVRHVLCRSGSPPLLDARTQDGGVWDVDAVGLMHLLAGMNEGRDHNDIPLAHPTEFVIGARVNPTAQDFDREVAETRRKVAAGAGFIITSPVYDLSAVQLLLDAAGVPGELPVLLGVMPLADFNHAEYLQQEVPDMSVPEPVLSRMWLAGDDAQRVGQELALELIAEARATGIVRGVVMSPASNQAGDLVGLVKSLQVEGK
jgi:homocysteine S-methyltransferase